MLNAFTIDTEEWFQVFYGFKHLNQNDWPEMDSHIHRMVDACLELLDKHQAKATFFILGWIAERYPQLIRKIHDHGNEVASHGYWHQEVFRQSRDDFYNDIVFAKASLEDAMGSPVKGYRAPGYSIRPSEEWALDLIRTAGYSYDSSMLHGPAAIAPIRPGLLEVAPNSIRLWGSRLPSNGGFCFRLSPYFFYKKYVQLLNYRKQALIFYTHTWEIDPDYPRLQMSLPKQIVQYANLDAVYRKLDKLLSDFKFTTIEQLLNDFSTRQNQGIQKFPV